MVKTSPHTPDMHGLPPGFFAPLQGRLSEIQIAEAWIAATAGIFSLCLPVGGGAPQWYRFKDDGRSLEDLNVAVIDGSILSFLRVLAKNGASIRSLSASKVRAIRSLAVMIRCERQRQAMERNQGRRANTNA